MAFSGLEGATRDVIINIRAKQNQRDLIDHAAELQCKTRSEFMLESAYQKAQDIILDQTFFVLDQAKFQQFEDLLNEPPTYNKNLQLLLTTSSPWD